MSFSSVPTYTEGIAGQPKSFFPGMSAIQNDKTISTLIFRGVFAYDNYGSLVTDLADTWQISDDGLVYTLKIKPDQKWSNGKNITADDLIYTASKVPDLNGVATDRVDDLTVRYTLPNKYAPFLSLMTVGIMQANSIEKQNQFMPISNGDWRIVRIDRHSGQVKKIVLMTSSPDYQIKRLIFIYYPNDDELETAAKLGEIQGFLSNKTHQITNFDDKKFPVQSVYYALFLNLRNDKFKDLVLRQKLEKALDIESIIYDKGITVEGAISRSPFTDRKLTFNKFDEKFSEDLSETTFTITVPDIGDDKDFVDKIRKLWEEKLGINTEIKVVGAEEIQKNIIEPRDFEVLFYGQETGRDPDRYIYWHSTQKDSPGLNLTGFEHVRSDRALEEGRNKIETEQRDVDYKEFQKVINDNTPVIFLYHPFTHFYVSKYITGVGEKYTFTQTDRFLDLKNWKKVATN